MPNHFSTIGLDLRSRDDYMALDARLIESSGDNTHLVDGTYLRRPLGSGAEAWCHLDREGRSAGFVPYFASSRTVEVMLTARVPSPGSPLDGAFVATLLGPDGEPIFPFVFEVPDFRTHDGISTPARRRVAVAGFTHYASIHADEGTYRATGSAFAAQSFIPSGMFQPGGTPTEPAQAYALLNGTVIAAEERINELTGAPFVGWPCGLMGWTLRSSSTETCWSVCRRLGR